LPLAAEAGEELLTRVTAHRVGQPSCFWARKSAADFIS
jgi:hypothetical protein